MSANFLQIASELRNKIYELLLLQEEPIGPWNKDGERDLNTGLLGVNKRIHCEASSLFYGQNCFDFTMCGSAGIAWFLSQIGPSNADYIRNIRIDVPRFSRLDANNITFDEESVDILTNIQSSCANVSTITMSLRSANAMEHRLSALDHPKFVTAALKLADNRLRALSSLQTIIIEVYEDGPSDHIRREIQRCGWRIKTFRHVEGDDFYRDFSDSDEGIISYTYDSDEYDIDNDSDFWSRGPDVRVHIWRLKQRYTFYRAGKQ